MIPSNSPLPPLLLFAFIVVAATSPLDDTCHAISTSRPDLTFDLCIASLSTDPASSSANLCGLALIATRLSIINTTNTIIAIQHLLDADTDPKTSNCLDVCLEVYSDAADHLRDAIVCLDFGKYADAVTFLSAAVDSAENCEDAFRDDGMSSPMAKDDTGFVQMAKIALAIAATLR